jgi:hypothetical protein
MVEAMREWGETQKKAYQAVLEKSGAQLAPFGDPLRVDFGTHRWLRKGHEESYSAWLAWIIEQLETPCEVFRLFKLGAQDEVISECGGATLQVQAEQTIEVPDGSGRLDIVVEYERERGEKVALIVVEVKRGAPAEGGLDRQLTGYRAWIDRQTAYKEDRRFPVLLSSEDDEAKQLPGAFIPVPWEHVCLGLRRLAPRYVPGRPTVAAMILGFVGAVEQNLLHMSLPGNDEPATTWVAREAVFGHIRATLETGERK